MLFACRGAFGVISEALDGCYVSSEFPTFVPVDITIGAVIAAGPSALGVIGWAVECQLPP